jgi:hypothetical protein
MAVETPAVAPTAAAPSPGPASPTSPPTSLTPLAGLRLPSLHRHEAPPRARALVLVDPDGAFSATVRRPLPAACLVFAALCALLPPVAWFRAADRAGGVDVVLVDELQRNGRLDRIPPALRATAVPRVVQATKVVLPVAAVARRVAWILAVAGVSFALLRARRPDARLATVVACAAVGAAPLYLADVIGAATFVVHDVRTLDPQIAVASNPAAWLFSGRAARAPAALALQGLDLFDLWACVWMGAGVARALGGRTTTPWVVALSLHAVATAWGVAQAAMS